jgi:hypothetical protein
MVRKLTQLGAGAVLLAAALCLGADRGGAGGWWPQFHGPNRDNVSTETGLLKEWPEGGPRLAWKFSEGGDGYSGIAIANRVRGLRERQDAVEREKPGEGLDNVC